ncbi:F-box-like domain-containing protein [Legionella brunensis]|uniref:F-box domain-containing protein n=1 Tax=Legionella brunensis TaxID=29422 RepID=A0A0W0SP16_9GAMM|nr:F-box-like domain-containing protein [Legionella brunensis]KTC84957.1 hypothetical protein Lbru_1172 [Legionella brunensis]
MLRNNQDIILTIFNFFPKKEVIKNLTVCKSWKEVGEDKRLWDNLPYAKFREEIKSLRPYLKEFVLSDVIDLKLATQI